MSHMTRESFGELVLPLIKADIWFKLDFPAKTGLKDAVWRGGPLVSVRYSHGGFGSIDVKSLEKP